MDLGSLLLAIGLVLLVGLIVARPLLEAAQPPETTAPHTARLAAEREAVLAALRDLDFDHLTGKISDEEHAAQRPLLVAQGVAILKQWDEAAQNVQPAGPSAVEAELESAVLAARAQLAQPAPAAPDPPPTCPHCGHARQPADRFCARCGAALAVERV
jgi:hypothetical protein